VKIMRMPLMWAALLGAAPAAHAESTSTSINQVSMVPPSATVTQVGSTSQAIAQPVAATTGDANSDTITRSSTAGPAQTTDRAALPDQTIAIISALGNSNSGAASQTVGDGPASTLTLNQTGANNSATLTQTGNGDTMALNQTGDANQATLTQIGNNLGLSVNQTGSQIITILQTGH